MDDHKGWIEKTLESVKKASEAGKDLVQRNYRRAAVKVDLAALRRSLDDISRDVGRIAIDRLRERGQVTVADVAHLLRRVDELEDQVAVQERLLVDLESDDGEVTPPDDAFDGDATNPGVRKGPVPKPGPPGA